METLEPMQEHNKEEQSQPSEMLRPSEVLPPNEGAVPQPQPSPESSLQEPTPKDVLLTGPFETVLEAVADMERDDPKLAFQASRLVGILRRLGESCVAKHRECEKTTEANQSLKQAGAQLRSERDRFQARHDQQVARLRLLDQAVRSSQEHMTGMLNQWSQIPRGDLADLVDIDRCE